MKRIRCQLFPKPEIPTVPLDEKPPPSVGPGLLKSVKVQGMEEYEFQCFSDAHEERDHQFSIGQRVLVIPWDKFRLQGKVLLHKGEVGWKESPQ